MAQLEKLGVETEVKCNAEKIFHAIRYRLHHLPTIFPEGYKGSEIIEGDGTKNGCVRSWHYIIPGETEVEYVKCKNEDMEHEKMTIALRILEGTVLKYYKSFLVRISVTPKSDGCLVKWTCEYQKYNEGDPDPHRYLTLFHKVNQKVDAHLLKE